MALSRVTPNTGRGAWDAKDSQLYERVIQNRPSRGIPTSPQVKYLWIAYAQQAISDDLSPYLENIDAIVAHPEGSYMNLHVFMNNEQDIHDLSLALAALEIKLSKDLRQHYDEVRVYPTPVWCLTETDKATIKHGSINLY